MATLLLLLLSINIAFIKSQNTTNDTTTSTPAEITTTSFFTSENIYQTDGTFKPSSSPTPSPVDIPTEEPTNAPTISIPQNKAKAYRAKTTCYGTNREQVKNNKQFFEEAAQEAACRGVSKEKCQVTIGTITEVVDGDENEEEETITTAMPGTTTPPSRRRRLEEDEDEDVLGVIIEYLVLIYDGEIVNDFNERISSGVFSNDLETLLSDTFEGITVEDVELTDEGVKDDDEIDEFLSIEEPTFGERFEPGFIFGGIISSIVGVVWILFLRSDIPNKYPSYLGQPAAAAIQGGNAVEMVPQTSAASPTAGR